MVIWTGKACVGPPNMRNGFQKSYTIGR
jgi:hypothetical protein